MANQTSPLQLINQKELALRQRVEAAQRQADGRVQAAREAAAQMVAQAEREGRAEAEARYRQGLEAAQREAEAIIQAGQTEADDLRAHAQARMESVVRQIVELVLPGAAAEDKARPDDERPRSEVGGSATLYTKANTDSPDRAVYE